MSVEETDTAVADGVDSEQTDMFASSDNGSGDTGNAGNDLVKVAAETYGQPQDFMKAMMENDPDIKAEIEALTKGGNKGSEATDAGKVSGEDSATAENEGDPPADDKDAGTEAEPAEFADDVIPGLKGEVFGKLPEEAQEAVAKFYQETVEKSKQVAQAETALNVLTQDPYMKARVEAAKAGLPMPSFGGLTAQDTAHIEALLAEKVGLSEEEAALAVEAVREGIEVTAQRMAENFAPNMFRQQNAIREAVEVNKQGDALMLGLAQFDKNLAVKETDIAKFYTVENGKAVYNERHPEIEKYKNGIGRFVEWAFNHGIDNRAAVKMGAKAFYAAAAADLGKTVVFNSAERDKKIAADARKSAINLFRKPSGGTLATHGTAPARRGSGPLVNGMDAIRLANDSDYYDRMVQKDPLNGEWLSKIDEAAIRGRALINNKT